MKTENEIKADYHKALGEFEFYDNEKMRGDTNIIAVAQKLMELRTKIQVYEDILQIKED